MGAIPSTGRSGFARLPDSDPGFDMRFLLPATAGGRLLSGNRRGPALQPTLSGRLRLGRRPTIRPPGPTLRRRRPKPLLARNCAPCMPGQPGSADPHPLPHHLPGSHYVVIVPLRAARRASCPDSCAAPETATRRPGTRPPHRPLRRPRRHDRAGSEPAELKNRGSAASGPFRVPSHGRPEALVFDVRTIPRGGPFGAYPGQQPLTTLVRSRTFANGDRILLVMAQPSGVANSGSVIRIRPGAAPAVVPIEYMTEFGALHAVDRLEVIAGGVQDINCGTTYWRTEIRSLARCPARARLSRDRCGNR